MSLTRTGAFALGLVTAFATPAIAYTALVQRWISDSGDTRIMIEISSQALEDANAPAGNYQQSGGAGGQLMLSSMNNGFQMRFHDTSGAERCVGRMTLRETSRDRAQATWQIDGTVEGYRCSTVGQSFQMNLRRTD